MSGCIIIAIALWSILWKHQYVSLLMTSVYPLISYGLLISGIFATFTAIFGCYVVWRDQRSMICCVSIIIFFLIYQKQTMYIYFNVTIFILFFYRHIQKCKQMFDKKKCICPLYIWFKLQ